MSPHISKTPTDEKIENHFNGIVVAILAIVALAILIVGIVLLGKSHKMIPAAHRPSPTVALRGTTVTRRVMA